MFSFSRSAQTLWSNLHVIRDSNMTDSRTCNRSARNCWVKIGEEIRIIPSLSLCSSLSVFWVIKLSCIPFTQMRLVMCNDLTFHFLIQNSQDLNVKQSLFWPEHTSSLNSGLNSYITAWWLTCFPTASPTHLVDVTGATSSQQLHSKRSGQKQTSTTEY